MTTVRALAPLVLLLVAAPSSRAAAQPTTLATFARLAQDPSTRRDGCRRIAAARAHDALSTRRWDEAATVLEDALALDGRDASHWRAYGTALYQSERYRESIAAFERAMQLGGAEDDGAWNVARAYARLDRPKQALRWLGSSLERGERSRQAAREEPAFAGLRSDPRFRELTEPNAASGRAHREARRPALTVASG